MQNKRVFRNQDLVFECPEGSETLLEDFYHEEEYIRKIIEHAPKKGLIYDIGAQYGAVTLALATTGLEVWAFEPHAPFAAGLRRNAELNPWARIRVFETAVALAPMIMTLFGETDRPPMPSLAQYADPIIPAKDPIADVPVLALSQLPPAALVKIDVEGFENEVLGGMTWQPELLAVELHPLVQEANEILFRPYELIYTADRGFERLTIWRHR